MNKLYWIICEENDRTLYEGRFLGRTRGAAMKHLKEQLGRSNLTGLVFSITEIPVSLIREIVAEMMDARMGNDSTPAATTAPLAQSLPDESSEDTATLEETELPQQGATSRSQYPWDAIKACYMQGRSPKDVAQRMNVPINTLKGRIRREGWAQERSRR